MCKQERLFSDSQEEEDQVMDDTLIAFLFGMLLGGSAALFGAWATLRSIGATRELRTLRRARPWRRVADTEARTKEFMRAESMVDRQETVSAHTEPNRPGVRVRKGRF